jgi:cytochrome oxidase Cu insertion factor (SCO1/SenC/PrrC family)
MVLIAFVLGLGADRAAAQLPAKMIEDNAPKVGERIPDITILDDQGNPFELHRLRGKHAVIVFGCLT